MSEAETDHGATRDACWTAVAAECPHGHPVEAHRRREMPFVHVMLFGAGLAEARATVERERATVEGKKRKAPPDPGAVQCLPGSEVPGYPGRFRPGGEIAPWVMKSWVYLEAENAGR